MATKTIKVGDKSFRVSSREDYRDLLTSIGVQFLQDESSIGIGGFDSVVDGGTYTLGPPVKKQKHQDSQDEEEQVQLQKQQLWHNISGQIERNRAVAGVRFKLVELASKHGYYPSGFTVENAFSASEHPTDPEKRLLSLSVDFRDLATAEDFQRAVDSYVNSTRGVDYHSVSRLDNRTVNPGHNPSLIYQSDYQPNKAEGEAPNDSPVWNVEISSVDVSSIPSSYNKNDTVYKFQRIETESAFGRCNPQGAHIFPKAKCKGEYEWLDKQKFNRLALSSEAHEQFDGTGRGKGTNLDTIPQICLEPQEFVQGTLFVDGKRVDRLLVHLWLRQEQQERTWRPFLPKNILIHEQIDDQGRYKYFEPLHIDFEVNRRVSLQLELQQNPDGSYQKAWATAIPGVSDPTRMESYSAQDHTVSVKEVVFYLLKWNYEDTRRLWRETP